jgi:hypothetical protein
MCHRPTNRPGRLRFQGFRKDHDSGLVSEAIVGKYLGNALAIPGALAYRLTKVIEHDQDAAAHGIPGLVHFNRISPAWSRCTRASTLLTQRAEI